MDENVAIATTNSLSESVSVSDYQEAPLSPIVGSGKKFRSRRRRRLQEKVETAPEPEKPDILKLKSALINLESFENVPGTSKFDLNTNQDIVSRIKKLEALKVQKIEMVEAISSNKAQSKIHLDEKPPEAGKSLEIEPTIKIEGIQTAINIPNVDNIEYSTSSHQKDIKNDPFKAYNNEHFDGFRGFSKDSIENLKQDVCHSNAKVAKNIVESDFKLKNSKVQTRTSAKNIFEGENFDDLMLGESVGFKKASFYQNVASTTIIMPKTCSNMDLDGSKLAPKKLPTNIFEGESFNDLKLDNNLLGFEKASDVVKNAPSDDSKSGFKKASASVCSSSAHNPSKNIFEGENFDDLNLKVCGFQSASSNMQSNPKPARNIFEEENFDDLDSNLKFGGFQSASANMRDRKPLKPIFEAKGVARDIFEGENFSDLAGIKPIITLPSKSMSKFQTPFKTPLKSPSSKSFNEGTSINTPENNVLLKKSSIKKRLGCRGSFTPSINMPEKSLKRGRLMFEEIEEELGAKRMKTSTPLKSVAKPLLCDLTPIQKTSFLSKSDRTLTSENNRLSLNKSTEGNVQDWLENLTKEKRLLEEKLRIINEKHTILTKQIMDKSSTTTRILPGVLYKSKTKQNRMSLKDYLGNCFADGEIDDFLNEINPQNAHLVHFNTSQSHLKTLDGAEIVSNSTDKIGLTEIAHSFQLIEGVDPNLIPKGWIENHFRWIIWKLASYERWTRNECLNVENVVQQLKYRYDLEIDKAKRSILRKIFEKDDCPQRRMVLCVSNIIQKNHSYELELTDGWYPIRTIIDQPLSQQISKGKIKIGLKLLIYASEIVNCDQGCHPLEAQESIYLKINYNCTRRALWWCKLGAQRDSGPFLVPVSSVCANGGKIGRLRCFILRVYPVQFMEKIGSRKVWRNRKAEERREQEFYKQNIEKSKNCSYKNLQNIQDPQLLYEIVQNEPEELQELLTSSQKTILYNYTITNKSSSFSNKSRAVTAMLKLKLIDAAENSLEIRDFFIWQPGEGHLDELKEGHIVTLFNVNCTAKFGLGAGKLSEFKREAKAKDDRFAKFKRKATKIEELSSVFEEKFQEFDCVGFVVRKQIEADCQKVWLADLNKRLLLIKIEDSPNNILVLDTVKECQIISVCNLTIKQCFERHFLAIGGLSVIFARYSQYKHLQEALEEMEQDFENLDKYSFLQDCQQKIIKIEDLMDGMECSQMTVTDMALLECMDKLC